MTPWTPFRTQPRRSVLRRTATSLAALAALIALAQLSACSEAGNSELTAPNLTHRASLAAHAGGTGGAAQAVDIKLIEPSEDHFVVELAPGVNIDVFAQSHNLQLIDRGDGIALVAGAPDAAWLATLPEVREASTDHPVNLAEGQDLVFGFDEGDWDEGSNSGQDAYAGLDLPNAHRISTGTNVLVAILDTGADLNHVFIKNSVIALGPTERLASGELGNRLDDDHDGLVDEAYGHGTHVTGIVHTVAPGAMLLPIRVLNDDGIGSLWDLVIGLQLALAHGARLVNMSLALSAPSEIFENAMTKLAQAGVGLVSAAGNAGSQQPAYPAISPLVLGVAALDSLGELATFSGAGPLISMAAPGTAVMSSYPGNMMVGGTGTSMATPIVSGALALLLGCGRSAAQAQSDVFLTAIEVLPQLPGIQYGRVDPVGALAHK